MKNVLQFVFRNHVFFLFLLIELVSFSLIVQNNRFQRTSFLNSSNYLVGNVYTLSNSVTEYFGLKQVNDELALENAALRSLLNQSKFSTSNTSISIVDSARLQHYNYIPTKVVNVSTDRRNNYLTINKGILQGVEPEMAVISSNGIIGIIKDVSKNYASVISILHKHSSISTRLSDSGYFGSLVWDGRNPKIAQLTDIPNHVKISEGMLVETSGYSSMFPSGVSIGKVIAYDIDPGDNFYSIDVALNTDLISISLVYVVTNLMRIEQKQLETVTQTDDD
ncbi:MAG: rod shape-determining protein MreC [Flavobacteriales bacterium]|nr:rod shape-determining protein MreC [Flavobacteriales bacterium]